MNLALLKKEARETGARMEARLHQAISENRELTAEEQAAQDADQATLDRQLANIARLEQLAAATASIGADPAVSVIPAVTVPASPRNPAPSNDGFASLGEFAQAVRFANPMAGGDFRMDDRLSAPSNVHTEQGDAAGSYLVPAEYREEIVDLVFGEADAIMNLIAPEPTGKNRVQGLGDETTPWGTNGVRAYWRSEADQMTASKLDLNPRETPLNEVYAFVNASEELLEDAPRLANYLQRKAPAAIRWKAVDAFVWGDGVGKPLGWMASDALVTVAKETGQAADTINGLNVAKAFSRMIDPASAVWLANSDTLPQLMVLESENGQPLWQPNFSVSPGGVVLGRPVFWTDHADTIGDKGDLQFVNPNGYEAFRKQNAISFAESIHLFFDYNVRAFRWIFRIGGQPVLSAPVTPARSAATKSHFVAIADRA
jgi:HK97 family phage major capsid protein